MESRNLATVVVSRASLFAWQFALHLAPTPRGRKPALQTSCNNILSNRLLKLVGGSPFMFAKWTDSPRINIYNNNSEKGLRPTFGDSLSLFGRFFSWHLTCFFFFLFRIVFFEWITKKEMKEHTTTMLLPLGSYHTTSISLPLESNHIGGNPQSDRKKLYRQIPLQTSCRQLEKIEDRQSSFHRSRELLHRSLSSQ